MRGRLREPGVYLLIINVESDCEIHTRGRKIFNIRRGMYIYVGSALRGLESRIRRYLEKKFMIRQHWHIDYLLSRCRSKIIHILCSSLTNYDLNIRAEILLSFTLLSVRYLRPVHGFGATDIRHLRSNLYYIDCEKSLEEIIDDLKEILNTLFRNVIELEQ